MKCPIEYWIWLQRALGVGKRADGLLSHFGDPANMYAMGRNAWIDSGLMSAATIDKLVKYSPSQTYDIIQPCIENGWSIITFDDECYPERLKEIYGFPLVLYVWGDPAVLCSKVCISMVGTRKASDYGLQVTKSLSYSLAKAGVTVVSGGALGVDSMAHVGALEAGGKTIAFLGCGLGYSYLNANGSLRRKIARNGAVVSEFPPFSPPSRQTFPVRNRLISGISLGTVVIEAGERSGALITARSALEQNRDVFVVPGDVTNANYFGANKLIRDGAKAVFSYMDILDEYIDVYGKYLNTDTEYLPIASVDISKEKTKEEKNLSQKEKPRKTAEKKEKTAKQEESKQKEKNMKKPELPSYATENAKKVFMHMSEEPLHVDKIISLIGLPVQDVLAALTELEMYGLVTMHSGKRYSLKIRN